MDQIILACDDEGNFLEYIPKVVGHTGEGRRHLAITVLIYNSKGQVLLQRRKHQLFDNIWDFTASTHPLHKEGEQDETFEQATIRALKDEYDIENISLKKIGKFNYFAPYHTVQGELCENEHCAVIVGEYDGQIKMDPSVGYEYKWVRKGEFLKDVESNSQQYTPWVIDGIKVLEQKGFFH